MMEYYSFEKVLKELQMEEDELKRLVSEGEIRAFRDEDKMKFKKSDIDGLKKGRMTEPTIILPSGEDDSSEDSEVLLVEEDTSETLLDIDDLDGADSSSTTVPTVDFSSSADFEDSSASETITEELTFEADSGSYVLESSDDVLIDSSGELLEVGGESSSGETFIESDTGLQTEPLDMDSDVLDSADFETDFADSGAGDETVPVDNDSSIGMLTLEEDDTPTDEVAERRDIGGTIERPNTVVVAPTLELSPLSSGLLILTTVIMLWTGVLMINNIRPVDTPLTGWFTDFSYEFISPTYPTYAGKKVSKDKLKRHMIWRSKKRDGKRR